MLFRSIKKKKRERERLASGDGGTYYFQAEKKMGKGGRMYAGRHEGFERHTVRSQHQASDTQKATKRVKKKPM